MYYPQLSWLGPAKLAQHRNFALLRDQFVGSVVDGTLCPMRRKSPPGLFITGSNTAVGKTFVGCQIARGLVKRGFRIGVYKPVASGCDVESAPAMRGGLMMVSEDARLLWEAANRPGEFENVAPQSFVAPLAPHLAARAEGRSLDMSILRTGVEYWRQRSDFVIVEGAGGLLCPLGNDQYMADLAADIGYQLVIVAANRLGVIGETLLALHASRTWRRNLHAKAIVLNDVDSLPNESDPSVLSNFEQLVEHAPGVRCTRLPHSEATFEPDIDWYELGRAFQ